MTKRHALIAVVAAGRNGVIGSDGGMPWSIPSDLKRYRRLTMGRPMIMGRRTLESIGKVLEGRDSIVLTHRDEIGFAEAILANEPKEALRRAEECADRRGASEIVIAGGGEIYRLFWPHVDRIALTQIDAAPEGDTVLPDIPSEDFALVVEENWARSERDSAATRFKMFERRKTTKQV